MCTIARLPPLQSAKQPIKTSCDLRVCTRAHHHLFLGQDRTQGREIHSITAVVYERMMMSARGARGSITYSSAWCCTACRGGSLPPLAADRSLSSAWFDARGGRSSAKVTTLANHYTHIHTRKSSLWVIKRSFWPLMEL